MRYLKSHPLRFLVAAAIGMLGAVGTPASLHTPTSVSTLALGSTAAVEADVLSVRSGVDPVTGRVATYIRLQVVDGLFGADGLDEIVLREPGGQYGDRVLVVDAAPQYRVGQRVVAFLDVARDGALRTQAMEQGRFVIADAATNGAAGLKAQVAAAREVGTAIAARPFTAAPPELSRVQWNDPPTAGELNGENLRERPQWIQEGTGQDGHGAAYRPLSADSPARWSTVDSGQPIRWVLAAGGEPGGDAQAARTAVEAAMTAWNDAPQSRVELLLDGTGYDWASQQGLSPATAPPSVNGILFGDPYDDIPDMVNCSGTLAIGGYWRSGSVDSTVNGVDYYPALLGYIIFNNGFDCFADTVDDVAEIATHELGHTLGFGHSPVSGAIMRATAYGNIGPTLADDDRDAAHCTYPHEVNWTLPSPGSTLTVGDTVSLAWSSTTESSLDAARTEIEVSFDGGGQWESVTTHSALNPSTSWTVPDRPTSQLQFRLLRPRLSSDAPDGVPDACTTATSGNASIEAANVLAGDVGSSVRVDRAVDGIVWVSWDPSCSNDAANYAVYSGDLGMLRQGFYNHTSESCSAGLTPFQPSGNGDRYFLVAPLAGGSEGDLGRDSSGTQRPTAASSCAPREPDSTCPS